MSFPVPVADLPAIDWPMISAGVYTITPITEEGDVCEDDSMVTVEGPVMTIASCEETETFGKLITYEYIETK